MLPSPDVGEPDPSAGDQTGARAASLVAATASLLLIAQQVAGKATRDALFLSHHDATDLPSVMVASAVLAIGVVLAVSRMLAHWSPRRVAPVLMVLNAVMFAAGWWLVRTHPHVAATVIYLHTAAVGAAVISAFWSLVTERFDPYTARQVIGRIAAGATAGGVLGGVAAWQLAGHVGLDGMLLGLAATSLVAAGATAVIGGAPSASAPAAEPARGAVDVLRSTRYLRLLALLVMLSAIGDSAIDYVFKASAAATFTSTTSLVTFFALFHAGAGVLTFALQTLAVRRSLEHLGLAGTIAFLPGAVMVTGAAALAAPVLATAAALRAAGSALESSLYRSGYELLYTPLPTGTKRPTKTLIDVGCDKLGAAVGSGFAMVAVLAAPEVTRYTLLTIALTAAAITLAITRSLHAGYVQALADNLRTGAIQLDQRAVRDATTRRTLADTTAINRDVLLAEIAALRAARRSEPLPADDAGDTMLEHIGALRSGDEAAIREALRRASPLTPALVGHVIPLLSQDELVVPVLTVLREAAPHATGQLIDALLDSSTPMRVRRRLPRAMRACRSQRAVDGLIMGLGDAVFEVRYRCATALSRIVSREPSLQVDRVRILAAAAAELDIGEGHLLDSDELTTFERDARTRQLSHSLTHVFTLLSLILDREPLHLAFRALGSTDERLRGTGREYLDNVLPPELRDRLAPHLGDRDLTRRAARAPDEVVDELLAARDSLSIDLAAVRRAAHEIDEASS